MNAANPAPKKDDLDSKILQNLLDLEQIDLNLFRGQSRCSQAPQVFGGQVMGQALIAANRTVEGLVAHSMHCYFLRGGDMEAPILYEVERARDGRTFCSRRVTAIQHGRQIFNLSVSFQKPEEGFNHQSKAPNIPPPNDLPKSIDLYEAFNKKHGIPFHPEKMPSWPFDIRANDGGPETRAEIHEPIQRIWFRLREEIEDDPLVHQAALAYATDLRLVGTSMRPHEVPFDLEVRVATLDHSLWFHRPFDIREWLLYDMHSPSASGGRGFNIGHIYDAKGALVASCTQEGLIRPIYKDKK